MRFRQLLTFQFWLKLDGYATPPHPLFRKDKITLSGDTNIGSTNQRQENAIDILAVIREPYVTL